MNLKGRDFLTLLDYTPEEIAYLVDLAAELKAKKKQLEDAKKELDEYFAGQVNGETAEAPAETTAQEESLA